MIRPLGLRDGLRVWSQFETLHEQVARPETQSPSQTLRDAWLGQLIPWKENRHSWVEEREGRLLAALSTRPRHSPRIWQVAHLLLTEETMELTGNLFQQLTEEAWGHRVEKVFLRLPLNSPLLPLAHEAQFTPYGVEYIYRQPFPKPANMRDMVSEGRWRERARRDGFAVFQLISSLASPPFRQAEGLSYQEWCQSRERAGQEWVWEQSGQIRGWLQARPWEGGTLVESLFTQGDETALLSWLDWSAAPPVYCLAYSFQTDLQRLLVSLGFSLDMENCLLIKRILAPLSQTCMAPARA